VARTPTQRQVYADLLERYGKSVADAFFAAVDDLRSAAEVQRVIAAYAAGNIEAALAALHIDAAVYGDLLDQIQRAYTEGGRAALEGLPARGANGAALVIRFDARNPAAESWLRNYAAQLVTRIVADQRDAIRASLTASMARGDNPRRAALDIVGRINPATGKREGGILGLTTAQEGYVRSARNELSGADATGLRNYLTRQRRDRRFDRSVAKAVREETALPPEIAAKAINAYERRLLQLRGETIGRVEAMTALQHAKRRAFEQAIASGQIAESAVRKAWRSAGYGRVRHTHVMLNGDSAAFNEPFVSSSGARMQHPMDTSLGAGAAEIINCRCDCDYRVDFLANLT